MAEVLTRMDIILPHARLLSPLEQPSKPTSSFVKHCRLVVATPEIPT